MNKLEWAILSHLRGYSDDSIHLLVYADFLLDENRVRESEAVRWMVKEGG